MKHTLIAGLAAGTVLAFMSATPAQADPKPEGRRCGFASNTDYTVESDTQTGEMHGGPLAIPDEEAPNGLATGTMTCTVQVGANSTHAGADAIAATGPSTTGAVALEPTPISYLAAETENVYLCTQLNLEGELPLYWDDFGTTPATGQWTNDINAACALAISASTPGEDEPPFDTLNPIIIEHVDPVLCDVLDEIFPPDGDVLGLYACPPYET